ncbi:proteasome activator [Ilumatobacter sp.]|uniref:proteasome activator n=1 Tax=Ilumatobacter sp. TaxID=1967498 RepID=UPI003C68B8ED
MSDSPVRPEVVDAPPSTTPSVVSETAPGTEESDDADDADTQGDAVTEPAKVMRIGSMIKQLLEEVRNADLDEASRERLAEVYERSVVELSDALSPDLNEELRALSLPFDHDEVPSGAELRVAKAQLVGWLEGLFHGIQASIMAQQFAAQQQMKQLPGQTGSGVHGPGAGGAPQTPQTGTYL